MKTKYKGGFTLVEIMVVTAIIGITASIGVPALHEAGIKTRARRIARELQTAGHAFVQYSFDHGSYPPDRTPRQIPDGMGEYLGKFPWAEDTCIGGQWDWDYQQFGFEAGVSVYRPNWGADLMLKVDEVLDDGNLSTGQFRQRSAGYIYILEE